MCKMRKKVGVMTTCSESGLWCVSVRACQCACEGESEYRKRYASHLIYEGPMVKKKLREVAANLTKSGSK